MRCRSSQGSWRSQRAGARLETLRYFLVIVVGLASMAGASPAAEETTGSDVAYVEAATGRSTASAQGVATELGDLDVIYQGTRLDLEAGAELRLCHYRLRKEVTLRGPLHVVISAEGIENDKGDAAGSANGTCAAPLISTVQGGAAYRDVAPPTQVALKPSIKISGARTPSIRKAVLWDEKRHKVASFARGMVRPKLADGKDYSLVVEFSDGQKWQLMLRASAAAEARTVILVMY